MNNRELIKYCINGNSVAQGVLFNKYYNQMYHLGMRILANHHDVEDVLIVAFARVFNYIHKFSYQGEGSLDRWIKTIIVNESIRFLKRKKQLTFYEEINDYDSSAASTIYDYGPDGLDTDQVYSILETMPDGYRMVFNLFAIEGYSHKEISEMLGISENTSKSQLRKARIYIIERIQKTKKYG